MKDGPSPVTSSRPPLSVAAESRNKMAPAPKSRRPAFVSVRAGWLSGRSRSSRAEPLPPSFAGGTDPPPWASSPPEHAATSAEITRPTMRSRWRVGANRAGLIGSPIRPGPCAGSPIPVRFNTLEDRAKPAEQWSGHVDGATLRRTCDRLLTFTVSCAAPEPRSPGDLWR